MALPENGQSPLETVLPKSIPVLIVGGGPVGLLQALLLSRLGGKYEISGKINKLGLILQPPA